MMIFSRKKDCNNKAKHRLPLKIYVGYLLLIVVVFTGVCFAMFITTGQTEAGGEADIAEFKVTTVKSDSDDLVIDMTKATTTTVASYAFKVEVDSEVRTQEKVFLTLPGNLPDGVSMAMKVDGSTITPSKSGNTYTYTKTLAPGTVTNAWVLSFSADPNNPDNVTEETTLSGIKLHVDVTQIN